MGSRNIPATDQQSRGGRNAEEGKAGEEREEDADESRQKGAQESREETGQRRKG
jgi:hypothetical protein